MNKERNLEVYRMRLNGCTYKEIAEKYDISVERARQICVYCKKTDAEETNTEFYRLIVDDARHNFTMTLYNTLKRIGIRTVPDLLAHIDDMNEHPENYVYIGEKSRNYLNEKFAQLQKNA